MCGNLRLLHPINYSAYVQYFLLCNDLKYTKSNPEPLRKLGSEPTTENSRVAF